MKRHNHIVDEFLVGMPQIAKDDKSLESRNKFNLAVNWKHHGNF